MILDSDKNIDITSWIKWEHLKPIVLITSTAYSLITWDYKSLRYGIIGSIKSFSLVKVFFSSYDDSLKIHSDVILSSVIIYVSLSIVDNF